MRDACLMGFYVIRRRDGYGLESGRPGVGPYHGRDASRGRDEPTFGELLIASLQEALAYARGEPDAPARVMVRGSDDVAGREPSVAAPPEYDPASIIRLRERLGVTPARFAALLNVRPRTVETWERGRQRPTGASRRLLQVVEHAPAALEVALRRSAGTPPARQAS